MDWAAMVHDPMFDAFSVSATLILSEGHPPVSLRAIDHTAGIEVSSQSGAEVQTKKPVAALKESALASFGITRDQLRNGSITLNGKCWTIHSTLPRPAPEGDGEMWLILKAE